MTTIPTRGYHVELVGPDGAERAPLLEVELGVRAIGSGLELVAAIIARDGERLDIAEAFDTLADDDLVIAGLHAPE